VWMTLWPPVGVVALLVYREIVFSGLRLIRKKGWNLKNVLLIGNDDLNNRITKRLQEADWTGFKVKRFLDQSKCNEITDCIKYENIEEVWVTYPLNEANKLNDLLYLTRHTPHLKFRYIPDISDFQLLLHNSVSEVAGIVTLELNHSPLEGVN